MAQYPVPWCHSWDLGQELSTLALRGMQSACSTVALVGSPWASNFPGRAQRAAVTLLWQDRSRLACLRTLR